MSHGITLMPCQIAAAVAWMATLPLAVATVAVSDAQDAIGLGVATMVLLGAAITLTVRGFFVRWDGLLRNAFELGRDSAIEDELRRIA